MKALMYLTKRSFINSIKKAVKKPVTLIAFIFGIAYGVFLFAMLAGLAVGVRFNSSSGLVIIMTLWAIYITLSNFMMYSSRKGVIFRPAHTHFVFTAPINPKLILLHGAWMNYVFSVIVWIILAVAGLTVFQVETWKVGLFFLAGCVLEIVLEVSVMVTIYANDRLPEKLMKGICTGIKILLIAITIAIVLYFRKEGISMESARAFIDWKGLQIFPVVGWSIAVYRLILLGPDTLNIVCSILYLLTVFLMTGLAVKMDCGGGYYEDAAKFADDYADMKKRKKNGEMVMGIEKKKKKFRKISETIQASGAKAIFYRQLLEYKKEKYFIFSKMSAFCLFFGVFFAYAMRKNAIESGYPQMFLLGTVAYISLVMTGYLGKWENELKTPYLFMIPDSAFKKLWYSTLIEHIKALVDGSLLCIPMGFFWKIQPLYVILCILIYTALQANRMYTKVIAQCLVGDVLGKTGQNLVRACIQMTVLGMGAMVAVLVGIFVNVNLIFPILLIYSIMVTVAVGLLASLRFGSMEQLA
ncbi:MAG: putative ABC exporter domain-containing protein [Clostridiales bacterium]|nr:putative ABC exporter domain-containing protein [Clostridiales bacterium]